MSPGVSQAQTVWNNAGTDWNTGTNWSSGLAPTAADTALFNNSFGSPTQPNLSAPAVAGSLTFAPSLTGGGRTVTSTGAQTLTIGGTGSTGITAYGPATYTFNGPIIEGANATDTLRFNATNGSTITLAGNSTTLTNLSVASSSSTGVQGVSITNGRFVLDNSTTNVANRLATTATIKQNGGGIFEVIGNAAGGTYNVGLYNTTDNSTGGVNTIRVTPNTTAADTVLNFANAATFSLRQGTRNVTLFEATTGELGSTNGPHITFVGTPTTGNGGLLANSATTPGFGIVKDSLGTNFATYSATAGVGIVSIASANQSLATITPTASPTAGSATTNTQFNAPASIVTPGVAVAAASFRISPAGPGGILDMGTNNLSAAAIMLDGANDYAITGTGTLFVGTHYLYVNNPNTVLSLQQTLTTAANAVVFAGPGFLDLTGTVNQNLATTQRVNVAGGVLRANNTQIGFSGASQGILNLTGGVLEIKGGLNGSGASADFTRPLGATSSATAGVVNFNTATAEQGSGGFSAFGSDASVNIGGASATLQWAQTNFVGDGYALKFGSTKSNFALNFQNPINLENGTAFQRREINVTDNTSSTADKTVLSGVITGSTPGLASLNKTGNGVLELTAANTYTGGTTVAGGTLAVNNTTGSSATGTGPVTVGTGATLSGSGFIGGTTTIQAGATVSPGNSPGTMTYDNANLVLNGNGNYNWQVVNAATGTTAGTAYDTINITGTGILDVSALTLSPTFKINLWSLSSTNPDVNGPATGWDATQPHTWTLVSTPNAISGFNAANFTINTLSNNGTSGFQNGLSGGTFSVALTDTNTDLSLVFTPSGGGGGAASFIYTDTSAVTLNVLRNGTLSATKTIQNNGTATGDATLNSVSNLTVAGTLTGVVANATRNLTLTPTSTTANGTTTGTLSVTPDGGANDVTVTVNVGNASFPSGNSSVGHGTALTASTPATAVYTNLSSSTTALSQTGTSVPALGTTATILTYNNNTGSDIAVSMAWRSRTASEASTTESGSLTRGYLISDVVDLTGMANLTGPNSALGQTDIFVLQLSYKEALLNNFETAGAAAGHIFLAYNNGAAWVNAVTGNIGGTNNFVNRPYQAGDEAFLGRWGVNTGSDTVWAVLNHNSEFAVIPEPSTFVLGGIGMLGLLGYRLRRRSR